MNYNYLIYFSVLAKTEHYTTAAARLGISQPALSSAIHHLETALGGVKLFEKVGRNIRLTDAGRFYQQSVEEAITKLRGASMLLRDSKTQAFVPILYFFGNRCYTKKKAVRYMIQAEFQKKRPWSGICLFCGIFLIGLFVFIFHKDDTATVGDLLGGLILGAFFCIVGSIFLFFNRRASLCIDETGKIKGKYHFFGKMDCEASHVEYASVGYNALTIHLKNGKIHTITEIENAVELVHAIRQNISFEVREEPDSLIQKLSDLKSNRRKNLIYCCVGTALMFVNIFITVFLTGQREMSAFSKTDWILFAIMGTIEIGTVIATFYFAQKAGKATPHMESLQYAIRRIIVETKPLLPGLAMGVYTDDNYSGRITLFGYPKESTVYYAVEKFDLNHKLLQTFTSELFKDPEALPEGLSDLIAISQKFITPS